MIFMGHAYLPIRLLTVSTDKLTNYSGVSVEHAPQTRLQSLNFNMSPKPNGYLSEREMPIVACIHWVSCHNYLYSFVSQAA